MSKARQVRLAVWTCYALAIASVGLTVLVGTEGGWPYALAQTAATALAVAGGLSLQWAFNRYGEHHWLFDWGVLMRRVWRRR